MRKKIWKIIEVAEKGNRASMIYADLHCGEHFSLMLLSKPTRFFQRLDRITVAGFIVDDLLSILPSVAVLNSGFKRFRLFRLNQA